MPKGARPARRRLQPSTLHAIRAALMRRRPERFSPKRRVRNPEAMQRGPLCRSFGIRALVFALCLVVWPAFGGAAPLPRVVLFDRPDSDELGLELSARLRGELRAAGFDVVVLALAEGTTRPPHAAARELEPAALI